MSFSRQLQESLGKGITNTLSKGYLDMGVMDRPSQDDILGALMDGMHKAMETMKTFFVRDPQGILTKAIIETAMRRLTSEVVHEANKFADLEQRQDTSAIYRREYGRRVTIEPRTGKDGSSGWKITVPHTVDEMSRMATDIYFEISGKSRVRPVGSARYVARRREIRGAAPKRGRYDVRDDDFYDAMRDSGMSSQEVHRYYGRKK